MSRQITTKPGPPARNITAGPGATYTYDAENRLVSTAGVTYTYDGDGKRLMKSNGTIYWYGTNSNALEETDLVGNYQAQYFFFNGQRITRCIATPGECDHYFTDHLGNSRAVWSQAGTNQSDFYPFGGERVISSGTPNHYKFTGKERDAESGLDNFGKRYYGSSVGRFMSVDPHDFVVSDARNPKKFRSDLLDPQGWNRYAYVTNNPLKFADWEGLEKYLVVYVQQPVAGSATTWLREGFGVNTGHAFIGLKDTTAHTETKAGFYPKEMGTVTPLSPSITGVVKDDSNHSWNVKQEYKITDDQYNAVLTSISNDKADPNLQYNLNTNNCTDWVMDTAGIAGVTLPDAT